MTIHNNTSKPCHLKWSNITKIVQIKDHSAGLIKSSIADSSKSTSNEPSSPTTPTPSFKPPKHKSILNKVSGQAHPSELMALMGPSGSGKTSLLDVLATRSSYNVGIVSLNDTIITNQQSKIKMLKRKIAYIKQTDIFFDHLTVKDQLTYTALLRLGNDEFGSREEKRKEVEKVVDLLRLNKCADTPIHLISGGERKRVNIGTELLTSPSLILLDEPTSGLDSTSAVALMSLLQSLAHKHGKTVITSIHQPSSAIFRNFDKVLFLADGCTVYYGTPRDCLVYVKKLGYCCPNGYNAADHWMDLLVEDSAIPDEGEKEEEETTVTEMESSLESGDYNTNDNLSDIDDNEEKKDEDQDFTTIYANIGDIKENHQPLTTKEGVGETIITEQQEAPAPKKTKLFTPAFFFFRNTQKNDKFSIEDITTQKRESYMGKATPKARLILAWDDGDTFAKTMERDMVNQDGDSVSVSTAEESTTSSSAEKEKKFNTSWLTQFQILLHRALKNSRSAILTTLNLIKSVCLGTITGLVWFQMENTELTVRDRSSFLFFVVTYWIFDAMFKALFGFPAERTIIFKERASGSYHLSAYFLAKTVSELPTRLLLPFIYLCISYWLSGINPSFVVFLGTTFLTLLGVLAGESWGLLVGATVMDFQKSLTIMMIISLSMLMAGGYYVQNIPSFMIWVQYLSPFKYSYNGAQHIIFNQNVPCDGSGAMEVICSEPGVEYATPEQVKDFLHVKDSLGFNIGLLFVMMVIPRYCAFIVLKMKKGDER